MHRISIRDNVWRFLFDKTEIKRVDDPTLNVVIVGAAKHVSRIYYSGEYSENNHRYPDCYSFDGIKPNKLSKNTQSNTCFECSQNIKGSGVGNSRACKFQQRIAVVTEDDIGGDVYQLNIPSKSIFGQGEPKKWPLQIYCKKIASNGAPITSVVTEMCLNTDDNGTRITFQPVRILDSDEFDIALKQTESNAVEKVIKKTFNISLEKEDIDLSNEDNFLNLAHVMGMTTN